MNNKAGAKEEKGDLIEEGPVSFTSMASHGSKENPFEVYDIDETVPWSSDEDDEDGLGGNVVFRPITSNNELTVLPPVPPVTVTLQPHHQTVPMGVVLSIIGAQVIVEGVEKHNPLNEGSILWITQTRSPLGIVDETFGPVKNPYYIIRHNSESEVPSGLKPGDSVSFVPEFANHIVHDKSLYAKAYDASGTNDEEISDEEFSDDEKEAEYWKMLKMKNQGNNHENVKNKKMDRREPKIKSRNWKRDHAPRQDVGQGNQVIENHRHPVPPHIVLSKMDLGNNDQCSSSIGHFSNIRPGFTPPFFLFGQNPGFTMQSAGANGIPFQPPQSTGVAGFPTNNTLPWLGQVNPQMLNQMNMQNGLAAFGQQIGMNPASMPQNPVFPTMHPGFGAGPGSTPWPSAGFGQNMFDPSVFAMVATQGQQLPFLFNAGQQAVPFNLQQMGHNSSINTDLATASQPETSAISSQGPYQNLSNPSQLMMLIAGYGLDILVESQWSAWSPPPSGWIKVNTGASCIDPDEDGKGRIAIGGVFRDEGGRWIRGFMGAMGRNFVFLAELMAIKEAIWIAKDYGVGALWVESDSLAAVLAINTRSRNEESLAIIDDIGAMLECGIDVKISFKQREANRAADQMARNGQQMDYYGGVVARVEEPPENVATILAEDVRVLRLPRN